MSGDFDLRGNDDIGQTGVDGAQVAPLEPVVLRKTPQ
jgi:hypothetical protein